MCFTSRNTTKYIAEEDIVCYKIVRKHGYNSFLSYYTYFKYYLNILYTMKDCKYELILEHYRQYIPIQHTLDSNEMYIIYGDPGIIIYAGYHSYISYEMCYMNIRFNSYVVKCIIPKGSTYYMNEDEYVSNQIIIKEWMQI